MFVSAELSVNVCISRVGCGCLCQQNWVWMLVSAELSVNACISRTECGCSFRISCLESAVLVACVHQIFWCI